MATLCLNFKTILDNDIIIFCKAYTLLSEVIYNLHKNYKLREKSEEDFKYMIDSKKININEMYAKDIKSTVNMEIDYEIKIKEEIFKTLKNNPVIYPKEITAVFDYDLRMKFTIQKDTTLINIKKMIYDDLSIDMKDINFSIQGIDLNDNDILSNYITNDDYSIHISTSVSENPFITNKPYTIKIQTTFCDEFDLEINNKTTCKYISDLLLKKAIKENANCIGFIGDPVLLFNKIYIKNRTILSNIGVSPNSAIILQNKLKIYNNDLSEFNIIVRTMPGKNFEILVNKNTTIEDLKIKIQDREAIPPDQQRIIYNGYQLEDRDTLFDRGISSCETVHLVLRLFGGMYHETSGKHKGYGKLPTNYIFIDCTMKDCLAIE